MKNRHGWILLLACISFLSLRLEAYAIDCSQKAGSLPFSDPANPIKHVIVIMQENHSFDNYFGALNQDRFYGDDIDGVTSEMMNPGPINEPFPVHHETNICGFNADHSWDSQHKYWDGGKNDHFVLFSGPGTMGFYTDQEIPFYYALANQFAVADRYFSSVLGPTFPNRLYLFTGTSFGHIANDVPHWIDQFSQKTIFDLLNEHGITWKYYTDGAGYLWLFLPMLCHNLNKVAKLATYEHDLRAGNLPQVVFLESKSDIEDEHPPASLRIGEAWVAKRIQSLIASPYWQSSVLFFTFDENGGSFDHVPPPEACAPDSIPPMLGDDDIPGDFTRYGFRVPFVAVSPYVKHHYVSHNVYDHTSILKFIEAKFNLPALTDRDANADGLLDLFDFSQPDFAVDLPEAPVNPIDPCSLTPEGESANSKGNPGRI